MSNHMIDCVEKENILMHVMVKSEVIYSNSPIRRPLKVTNPGFCANISMHKGFVTQQQKNKQMCESLDKQK